MSALPAEVYQIARELGVEVYRVGSDIIMDWNSDRGPREYRWFCGWYWSLKDRTSQGIELRRGPYPCPSAAFKDAREYLEDKAATSPKIARVIRRNLQIQREARA